MPNWFEVDRAGLALQVEGRPPAWVLWEVLANSLDAPGVTQVKAALQSVPGSPTARLTVVDDAPEGVKRLEDLWTIFAPSTSAPHPTRRGRFCLGEKLLLAIAKDASVLTVSGGVVWNEEGRKRTRQKTERGTRFEATLRLTREQVGQVLEAAKMFIPPPNITVTLNNDELLRPKPVATVKCALATENTDEAGVLRRSRRQTEVTVFEPLTEDGGWLYELGIPVVSTGDRYSYDVSQKVPLNRDRDNVPPRFLQEVRAAVLDAVHKKLDGQEEASAQWVRDALPKASDETVKAVVKERFGKAVIFDPSDKEGSHLAASKGYTVVSGGAMGAAEWEAVRRTQALLPAGQVTPSPKILCGPDGEPPIPIVEWTPAMHDFGDRVVALSHALLGHDIYVDYMAKKSVGNGHRAWFGQNTITFHIGWLGKNWIERPLHDEDVLSLIIHELGHAFESDHLSAGYHRALCDLGARCARLALEKAELFR